MQVTLNFQEVCKGLPPRETDDYSIECIAVIDGAVFDRSVKYCFDEPGGWVWADMALGYTPDDYIEELGGDQPKVTHWAPWPVLQVAVAA